MREIYFRGINNENGYWEYGDLIHDWVRNNTKPDIMIHNNIGKHSVDPITVGQYTGLTDKNGKKIFEGDIVRLDIAGILFQAVCKFHSGSFGLVWHYMGAERWQAFTGMCHVEYEVIGNIFDNPELMEGE